MDVWRFCGVTPSIQVPHSLEWLETGEEGRTWLAQLPAQVERCVERWDLTLGEPFPTANVSFTVPARRRDGTEAVLKVPYPDRESEHEAQALAVWAGDGAVMLLEEAVDLGAFLIERCVPGTPLSSSGQDVSLDVLIGLLRRLWRPVPGPPFRSLAEEAGWWASHLRQNWEHAGRPFAERLVDAALAALRDLPPSQGEQVLVHQDLHGGNVLRARREPWLVIDPKPLAGEREFALAPVIRSFELGAGRLDVRRRLDLLTSELGLDRERARLWCIAQTVAWYSPGHIDVATWLLDM